MYKQLEKIEILKIQFSSNQNWKIKRSLKLWPVVFYSMKKILKIMLITGKSMKKKKKKLLIFKIKIKILKHFKV